MNLTKSSLSCLKSIEFYILEGMLMPQRKLLLLIMLMLSLSACSTSKYLIQPADKTFRIDGDQVEWSGRFQLPKGESFALGLSSNKNYLYLALASMDKNLQRQLAVRGLTLWLDVKGGKRQHLGIKYQRKLPLDKRQRDSGSNFERGSVADRRERLFEDLRLPNGDLDLIIINEKGRERLGPADLLASAQSKDGSLFIEYQIPLVLLGSDFDPRKVLGIGIESSLERPDRTGNRSEAMSGGGHEAMQGGRSGRQMGGGRSQDGNRSGSPNHVGEDKLEAWVKAQFPLK